MHDLINTGDKAIEKIKIDHQEVINNIITLVVQLSYKERLELRDLIKDKFAVEV